MVQKLLEKPVLRKVNFHTPTVKLLIILLVFGFLPILYNFYFAKKIRLISANLRDNVERRNIKITELLNNAVLVHVHGLSERFKNQIRDINNNVFELRNEQSKQEVLSNSISNFIYDGMYKIVTIILGLQLVRVGEISFGELVLVVVMLMGLQFLLSYIGSYVKNIQCLTFS